MRAAEFVEVGGELMLATFCSPESRFRSAVGRAYYGVYHEACELLTALGAPFDSKRHGSTTDALFALARSKDDELFRDVAVAIKSLYAGRQKADYRFDDTSSQSFRSDQFSMNQVLDGKWILTKLDLLRQKHVR